MIGAEHVRSLSCEQRMRATVRERHEPRAGRGDSSPVRNQEAHRASPARVALGCPPWGKARHPDRLSHLEPCGDGRPKMLGASNQSTGRDHRARRSKAMPVLWPEDTWLFFHTPAAKRPTRPTPTSSVQAERMTGQWPVTHVGTTWNVSRTWRITSAPAPKPHPGVPRKLERSQQSPAGAGHGDGRACATRHGRVRRPLPARRIS